MRKEIYPLSAWNNAAKWGAAKLFKGQYITVQGFLTQRHVTVGDTPMISMEISVEEFTVAKYSTKADVE